MPEQLHPEMFERYLDAHSAWSVVRQSARRRVYEHLDGARVFVPTYELDDFNQLAQLAVEGICGAERRSTDEVEADLAWRRYDRLLVRRQTANSSLSVSDALAFHEAARDIAISAARASVQAKGSYMGRLPSVVESYVEQVRVLPSMPGSFVLRLLLPIDPASQLSLGLAAERNPLREMSTTIMSASREAVRIARAVAGGADMATWDTAVLDGVSANLVGALARITGSELNEASDADLNIKWTWAKPQDPVPEVTVSRSLVSVLNDAHEYLLPPPDERTISLVGLVTKLHREASLGPGQVTVKGVIEGRDSKVRTLRFEVDERLYHLAVQAHRAGQSVRVRAAVTTLPRGLQVEQVESLRAV